jgi:serine protease Do
MTRQRESLAFACLGLGLVGGLVASQRLIGQPAPPAAEPPALPRDWMSYSPVVQRVLPAVVCIEGTGKAVAAKGPQFAEVDPGFGSGVLIDASGVVLTSNHVVAKAESVEVTLHDGRKFTTKDIRRDAKADLAVVKLETKEPLPALEFGDSDAMEVGDRVLAVGAPFGLTGSVTQGIVSAKSRQNLNLNVFEDFLQFDAAVNSGNSGGPLVNMEGKIVGLTAAIKTRTGGFQGVGLAVSSKLAKSIAAELVKHGAVRRPSIGLQVRDLDEATAAKNRLKDGGGVVVTEVAAKSPAQKANLGVGDVITSLNGQQVSSAREMQKAILALPVGKEVPLLVVRNGVLFRTSAAAEEQADVPRADPRGDDRSPPTIDFDATGLAVTEITADVANRMSLPKDVRGVVVANLTRGGLAEQSGLARGAVILQVDRKPVTNAEEFRTAVSRASREKGAVLHVLRPNGDIDFVILRGE